MKQRLLKAPVSFLLSKIFLDDIWLHSADRKSQKEPESRYTDTDIHSQSQEHKMIDKLTDNLKLLNAILSTDTSRGRSVCILDTGASGGTYWPCHP